jgi:hypothetical protein
MVLLSGFYLVQGIVINLLFYLMAGFFVSTCRWRSFSFFSDTSISELPPAVSWLTRPNTVDLIYPLVIASVTSGFIWVYTSLYRGSALYPGPHGSLHLAIGWVGPGQYQMKPV